ncbi:hypothetical protein SAMN05443432_10726 [Roseovarius litoreus]|uniref:Uncharacterized protein n=1 Tax=Roseovarius litoreus TaxID=1155722 RepID=A0A1M7IE79_9RHOB|nr:hypothetical protein SAMN05443432_10726 [Roseovarius litoreus]
MTGSFECFFQPLNLENFADQHSPVGGCTQMDSEGL